MEGVAGLESPAEMLPGPGIVGCRVHGGPFGRQPGGPVEAPVGVGPGNPLVDSGVPQVLEEAAAHHLADLRLVIGDEVLGNPVDDLGDALLPLPVGHGHLDLAPGQAHHRCNPGGAGYGHREVLEEGVEVFPHVGVPVDEVEHLVEEDQHRRIRGGEDVGQGTGPRG